MEVKLQLSVFVLLIQVSLADRQRVTVIKGQTLSLTCPLTNAHKTNVDWKNPEGYIMFFNAKRGEALKDKRYSITNLSESEFSISISNVTFKDGGNYTCSQYHDRTTVRKVEVTVIGLPKMEVTKHDGKFVIKCTAEGNHFPPQIFWKLNRGPEILAHAQVHHGDKKYVSMDMLHLHSVKNRVTVKCLVRHPALLSKPLMNFVQIQQHFTKPWRTTTTRSPITQPRGSTEGQTTTSSWSRHGRTTVYHTTTEVDRASSHSSTQLSTVPSNQLFSSSEPKTATAPTGLPLIPVTSTGSQLNTSGSTRKNDTVINTTSTTGWTSETTEEITSHNRTEGNTSGSINDQKFQINPRGSSLLVFLVTCLIFGLLVVVGFFAIKLRRAHITWKRENEDSDPSVDSSKSKSSQEDKNSQGQRRRGLFNTAFTRYEVEKPAVITSVINPAVMADTESENKEQTSPPQTQTSAKCDIKETEL